MSMLRQAIIIGVTADPLPDNAISLHNCQGAVSEADSRRIHVVIAVEFLELQAEMPWIAPKQSIDALGVPLSI